MTELLPNAKVTWRSWDWCNTVLAIRHATAEQQKPLNRERKLEINNCETSNIHVDDVNECCHSSIVIFLLITRDAIIICVDQNFKNSNLFPSSSVFSNLFFVYDLYMKICIKKISDGSTCDISREQRTSADCNVPEIYCKGVVFLITILPSYIRRVNPI